MQRSTEVELARARGPQRSARPSSTSARGAFRSAAALEIGRGRRRRGLARARCAGLHHRRAAQHVAAASTRTETRCCDNSPSGSADIGALERTAPTQPAAPHADHGARPGPGLYRPGPRHRRRCWRRSISTSCATTRRTSTGRSATASCSRPAIIRSRCGRRWPRPASSRSTSSSPTAPTTAGWRCRRSTPRPASR